RPSRRPPMDGLMKPAMPGRRPPRRLGITVIDHPAPLEAERRIDRAALGAEIAVALLVGAHQFTEPPGPQLGAEGLAVPPCEELEQKQFHRPAPVREKVGTLMPLARQIVQLG